MSSRAQRPPPSAVLARAREFLPQLAAANEALERKVKEAGAAAVDVEHVDEGKPYIEMNLGLTALDDAEENGNDHEPTKAPLVQVVGGEVADSVATAAAAAAPTESRKRTSDALNF